jgi:threonine aldolase
MHADPIDLRSDLLSRPTAAIIEAVERAMRRPGAFELREDPDQRELEEQVATILGKEDALLFPTCTAANQTALVLLSRPGTAVVTQTDPHILTSEAGAYAAISGVTIRSLPRGAKPTLQAWTQAIDFAADELRTPVTAISLENTHNRSGGIPLDTEYTQEILALAHRCGLATHLDGARLANAALATGQPMAELAQGFDTVSLSLNKGLCAPIGSILAGSKQLIRHATVIRQRLGGGIRPTAIIAAAGLAAIRDLGSIEPDHRRAKRLADLLALGGRIRLTVPETNIVLLPLDGTGWLPGDFCAALAREGLLSLPFGDSVVRFVTYHGLFDDEIDRAAEIIKGVFDTPPRPPEI